MLNKNDLRDLIQSTLLEIELTGAVIEKDYYVTQIINTLSNIENENFRLIFAGGTCLAKAHQIIDRMSEDIDFKIQMKHSEIFSRSSLIKALKEFRSLIKSSLVIPELTVIEDAVRNEGKYERMTLQYPQTYAMNATLRPHLLVEFTFSNARDAIEYYPVKTLIEKALPEITLFTPPKTPCISVNETAIEKWVGLTRRISAIERQYHHDDPTLVRHIYDLNAIKRADKINSVFFDLAKIIVDSDAKQFKYQHPEYYNNPSTEIRESLTILKEKVLWKQRYQQFTDSMVYDKNAAPDYESAVQHLEDISKEVISAIG